MTKCTLEQELFLKVINSDVEYFEVNEFVAKKTTFKNKVKFIRCKIDDVNFYNAKFMKLADFYATKFRKSDFVKTDFNEISVFSETEFNDIDFKYTKFIKKAIFRDTVVKGKLNLRNSIFYDEANFLDITSVQRERNEETKEFIGEPTDIKVANRETARIIKNFYDNSNNIIEANRFYKLEMNQRQKEIKLYNKEKKAFNFDWFIYFIHQASSEHSQNWFLPILWMLIITTIYSLYQKYSLVDYHFMQLIILELTYKEYLLLIGMLIFSVLFTVYEKISKSEFIYLSILLLITVWLCFLYLIIGYDKNLGSFLNNLNPFSIMLGKDPMSLGLFFYKVMMGYLIYQLIISVRQNTRRK